MTINLTPSGIRRLSPLKTWRVIAIFLFSSFAPAVAERNVPASTKGIVTHRISGCDYFIVETSSDYDLLEWFGGYDPDKGDSLIGDFESFGFHDIYDKTSDQDLNVYTEDYDLSKSDALEKLAESCE